MMQGETPHGQKMFEKIKQRPALLSLLLVLGIYLVVFIAILIWLSIHADVTTQRRIAQSPSVTVTVKKPETATTEPAADDLPDSSPVPSSWDAKNDAAPADAASPETPAIEQDQPPAATADAETTATTETTPPEMAGPMPEGPTPQAAWQKLARPFNQDDPRPRIGLIVVNLGITNNITKQAVDTLPPDVTLAFQAVSPAVAAWIEKSKIAGHENLLAVPMEPYRYPQNDPGPQTLLTILPKEDNTKRLNTMLGNSADIVGIIPAQGEKFVTNERAMAPVLDTVKGNGLIFVDGTLNTNSTALSLTRLGRVPFVQVYNVIDASASRQAIDKALTDLEEKAKQDGHAVAIVLPYPVTFERLESWIKTLPEKNLQLAPISAFVSKEKPAPAATPADATASPTPADSAQATETPTTATP